MKRQRNLEAGLALLVALAIAAVGLSTWHDARVDRDTTLGASKDLTQALLASVDSHVEAVFRDAANAAAAAAEEFELAGAPGSLGEEQMHRVLRRMVPDTASTARLLVVAADGRVLAASSEYPVRKVRVEGIDSGEPLGTGTGRPFRLALPARSPFGAELVLPLVTDLAAKDGRPAPRIRAEVRVHHFVQAWAATIGSQRRSVVLGTRGGATLVRVPLRDEYLLGQNSGLEAFQQRFAQHARGGDAEFASVRDGVTRLYSWRWMSLQPLFLAAGPEKEAVLGGWHDRTARRVGIVVAAAGALVLLVVVFAWHQRRLAGSETALLEARTRYLATMETSDIPVIVADTSGRWVRVNEATCALTGYGRDELLSLPAGYLLASTEDLALRSKRFDDLMSGRARFISADSQVRRKDGALIWVHVHSEPLRDPAGKITNLIIHAQDITQRKQAEQALLALNQELEQRVVQRTSELTLANQELEAFSYSAAHDIRSPLVTLSKFMELLGRDLGELPVKAARRLESIRGQIGHMMQTVDDLLALSRSGHSALRTVPVDIYGLAGEICEQLDLQAGERSVTWALNPMPEVLADRGSLREALTNILGNALKYSRGREHTRIEMGCTGEAEGLAEFYVRDNGFGFDPAKAADLFKPFKRLHSAAQFEGTGVGLAIVQRIIERNGGHIRAEAPAEGGAVFRFTLRLNPADGAEPKDLA